MTLDPSLELLKDTEHGWECTEGCYSKSIPLYSSPTQRPWARRWGVTLLP